jgi:RHS repeat-associated protein
LRSHSGFCEKVFLSWLGQTSGAQQRQATSLLYSGEQFDSSLQQYHLRARNYNQANGQFTTLDPYSGNLHDPQSLHKYAYCHTDPVNGVDPSGEMSIVECLTSFSIRATLVRMAVGSVIGVGDAWFRGYSLGEGAFFGAFFAALGPKIPLWVGIPLTSYGIGEAFYNGDYDSAFYRIVTAGIGLACQAKGFGSFVEFKKFFGSVGRWGKAWHHIVEQNPVNSARFSSEQLNSPLNVIPVDAGTGSLHAKVTGFYNSSQPMLTGPGYRNVRAWISTKTFTEQYQFGVEVLARFGGSGNGMNIWALGTSWIFPATLDPFVEGQSQPDEE